MGCGASIRSLPAERPGGRGHSDEVGATAVLAAPPVVNDEATKNYPQVRPKSAQIRPKFQAIKHDAVNINLVDTFLQSHAVHLKTPEELSLIQSAFSSEISAKVLPHNDADVSRALAERMEECDFPDLGSAIVDASD